MLWNGRQWFLIAFIYHLTMEAAISFSYFPYSTGTWPFTFSLLWLYSWLICKMGEAFPKAIKVKFNLYISIPWINRMGTWEGVKEQVIIWCQMTSVYLSSPPLHQWWGYIPGWIEEGRAHNCSSALCQSCKTMCNDREAGGDKQQTTLSYFSILSDDIR